VDVSAAELCVHLREVPADPMPEGGCEECLAIGGSWVHLRFCVTCRSTLCCDASPHRHATGHYAAVGHPVARSKEPGETWAWCYEDEVFLSHVG
jgi:hypothetical protein